MVDVEDIKVVEGEAEVLRIEVSIPDLMAAVSTVVNPWETAEVADAEVEVVYEVMKAAISVLVLVLEDV